MHNITWDIVYLSPPPALKYCKKCGEKKDYHSSGLFRVNAQRKHLDIWLIYKCSVCESTWNMTLYTRINPKSIAPELLEGFHRNSSKLAMEYAMDGGLVQRNGAEVGVPTYEIRGETLDFSKPTTLKITSPYPSKLKVASLLREKTKLSKTALDQLLSSGRMNMVGGHDLKKCKLQTAATLCFFPEAFAGSVMDSCAN